MLNAILKQLPWMLALFVLGPIAAMLTGALRAVDGSGNATLLLGIAPAKGILAGLVTLGFAGGVGVFASRLNGSRSGLNAAGIVLAWAASQTATIDAILRRADSAAPLTILAVEGLVFGLLAVPVAAIIWQAGLGRGLHGSLHPLPDGSPSLGAYLTAPPTNAKGLRPEHESLTATLLRAFIRPAGLGAIGVTVVVGFVISYLVCQDTLKGQAIFAAALTGIVAVPVGRMVGETLKEQPPLAAFVAGFAVLGLVGPLAAKFMQGSEIIATLYQGDLLGVAAPVSLDWIAGACIGLPIGEAWFLSMFQSQTAKTAASR
ncbi:hypothetical protein MNBD_PLANCTO03-1284 [hydrothermal vent metagenome]|uniref:Uncharacterized protein n=1 Tax=hydrothermal vent metagenome TaxID=652676 RepID=A0A3B1D8B7_9ZZZZ